MKLDFSHKPCPIPVIETKKALFEALPGEEVRIIVDNDAARENIKRLLNSLAQPYEILNGYEFVLIREKELVNPARNRIAKSPEESSAECVLFKSSKIGEGELGGMLAVGFLTALAQRQNLQQVILINDAVLMACDESHPAHAALRKLVANGVEIVSCANCLNYFAMQPKIGRPGDASSIMDALFELNTITL